MRARYAPVAQLDRVTGYEPVGRGFESLPAYQRPMSFSHGSFALLRRGLRSQIVGVLHWDLIAVDGAAGPTALGVSLVGLEVCHWTGKGRRLPGRRGGLLLFLLHGVPPG